MAINREPKVLILGHSFVKHLNRDLRASFDLRVSLDFNFRGTASIVLHGVGGRTVDRLRNFDLQIVQELSPDIVLLEIGTNDLSLVRSEVVGSAIEELVVFL